MQKSDRRKFFKASATLAGAAAIGAPAIAKSSASANDRVRVGLVGMGGRMQAHVRALVQMEQENVEIVAVCDCDQPRLEAVTDRYPPLKEKKLAAYSDMRAMFDDPSIDAVSIGIIYAPIGSREELWAIRPDGRGVVTDTHVAWKQKRAVPRRPSVLLVRYLLFMVDDSGVGACVEADSGKEFWRKRIGGKFSASPIYTDGRIYCFDQDGTASILKAVRQFEVLATNRLDEGFMASPAVSGDAMFLRSRIHLYRIEDQASGKRD